MSKLSTLIKIRQQMAKEKELKQAVKDTTPPPDDGVFRPALTYNAQVSDDFWADVGANATQSGGSILDALKQMIANPGKTVGGLQDIVSGTLFGGADTLPRQTQVATKFQEQQEQRLANPLDTFRQDPYGMLLGEGGLAVPFLPKAVKALVDPATKAAGGARQLGSAAGKGLYKHALSAANKLDNKVLNRMVKTGVGDEFTQSVPLRRAGLKIQQARRKEVGAEIGRMIDEASEAGASVDPLKLSQRLREKARTVWNIDDTSLFDLYIAQADDIIELSKREHGSVTSTLLDSKGNLIAGQGPPNQIPVSKIQEYKKQLGKSLEKHWNARNKTGNVGVTNKAEVKGEVYSGYSALQKEAVAGLAGPMKKFAANAELEAGIENLMSKRSGQQYIPSDITLPLAVEIASRGKPGVATAIGVSRKVGAMTEDILGRLLEKATRKPGVVEKFGGAGAGQVPLRFRDDNDLGGA